MKALKGIRHPNLKQSVKNGAIIFGISVVGAACVALFDLGITAIMNLFI